MSIFGGLLGYRINCDVCGKNFKINLKEELEADGKLWLFTCSHCSTDYPVALVRPDGSVEDRRRVHAN